jgi:hypothetical protein
LLRGPAEKPVLIKRLAAALAAVRARRCLSGAATARVCTEFEYQTQKSWSRARRVIGQAEVSAAGDNPRFVVTNLPAAGFPEDKEPERFTPTPLYEDFYCARVEMENVLKQPTLDWAADRLRTHWQASNQLPPWLATLAYLRLDRVRVITRAGTALAQATAGTVRRRWCG